MNRFKKGWPPCFLLTFMLSLMPLVAQGQVLFYSQQPQVARENIRFFVRHADPHHRIVPLVGNYDLLDGNSGRSLGQVNVPTVFHQNHPFDFRLKFSLKKSEAANYRLHFETLTGFIKIAVNRRQLYQGSRNFLPLDLPLSANLLADSLNELEVTIQPWNGQTNQLPLWMPVNLPRIDNGLAGPVYIEVAPTTYIENLSSSTKIAGDSTFLEGNFVIRSGRSLSGNYTAELIVRGGQQRIANRVFAFEEDSSRALVQMPFRFGIKSPELWSPENPRLYSLKVTLSQNGRQIDSRFRFLPMRKIGWSENAFLLNDSTVKINGINYIYQDRKGVSLLNKKLILEDLNKIKAQGFNAVRVGFYPQSGLFYHLADSLGLLCFQDLPLPMMMHKPLEDSLWREEMIDYAAAFVRFASPHPSLVGIGFGAPTGQLSSAGKIFLSHLRSILESDGQFTVVSCSPLPDVLQQSDENPICFSILERNQQDTFFAKLADVVPPHSPVLFSALSRAISYRVDSTAFTHDLYQVGGIYDRLNSEQWKKRLAGQFILTFSDYYLNTPSLQAGPPNHFRLNTLGIYDLQRNLKPEAGAILDREKGRRRFASQLASEKKSLGTFLFIFIGLINFLAFLAFYRSLIDFRHNVHRSLRRPHGFFTDIQERRLISYGESFFLMIFLSVNGAVMMGGVLYFFRNNFYMDYLLSLFFPNPQLKLAISAIIWKPFLLIPVLAVLIGLVFLVLAIPIRLHAVFREPRIHTRQAIAVSIWAGSNFIILLPVGMFFYNLLLVLNSYWILLAILLYFHVWYIFRWINGARVMTEIPYARVFLYFLIVLVIGCGSLYYYLQNQVDLTDHLRFLIHLYRALI